MSFLPNLYFNIWSSNPELRFQQTGFLSEIIYGYLIESLSTPSSLLTWDEKHYLSSMKLLMHQTAAYHRDLSPAAFIQALFLVLRFKHTRPKATAFNRDALMLYFAAFFRVASEVDPCFTVEEFDRFLSYIHIPPTHLSHYHSLLADTAWEDNRSRRDELQRIQQFFHFYLSPFIPPFFHREPCPSLQLSFPISRAAQPGPIARSNEELITIFRTPLTMIPEEGPEISNHENSDLDSELSSAVSHWESFLRFYEDDGGNASSTSVTSSTDSVHVKREVLKLGIMALPKHKSVNMGLWTVRLKKSVKRSLKRFAQTSRWKWQTVCPRANRT